MDRKLAIRVFFVLLYGKVEPNPGSTGNSNESYLACLLIITQSFLLKAYIAFQKFDIICLSETYPDFTVALGDDNSEISGYKLVQSDQPSSNKRSGVCLCYKSILPFCILDI